jgi:hypothetical protein
MALRPTQGDEKHLLSSNRSPRKRRPPLLSSRPGFPVTQHRTRQRVRLSVRKGACSSRNPPTSTGNPGSVPRISYYAVPETATRAAFFEESRMKFAGPPSSTGNPGEAEGSAVPRTFPGNVFRQSVPDFLHAALVETACAPFRKKVHEAFQSRQVPQEIGVAE